MNGKVIMQLIFSQISVQGKLKLQILLDYHRHQSPKSVLRKQIMCNSQGNIHFRGSEIVRYTTQHKLLHVAYLQISTIIQEFELCM
jgi:hypothetical protein